MRSRVALQNALHDSAQKTILRANGESRAASERGIDVSQPVDDHLTQRRESYSVAYLVANIVIARGVNHSIESAQTPDILMAIGRLVLDPARSSSAHRGHKQL